MHAGIRAGVGAYSYLTMHPVLEKYPRDFDPRQGGDVPRVADQHPHPATEIKTYISDLQSTTHRRVNIGPPHGVISSLRRMRQHTAEMHGMQCWGGRGRHT